MAGEFWFQLFSCVAEQEQEQTRRSISKIVCVICLINQSYVVIFWNCILYKWPNRLLRVKTLTNLPKIIYFLEKWLVKSFFNLLSHLFLALLFFMMLNLKTKYITLNILYILGSVQVKQWIYSIFSRKFFKIRFYWHLISFCYHYLADELFNVFFYL